MIFCVFGSPICLYVALMAISRWWYVGDRTLCNNRERILRNNRSLRDFLRSRTGFSLRFLRTPSAMPSQNIRSFLLSFKFSGSIVQIFLWRWTCLKKDQLMLPKYRKFVDCGRHNLFFVRKADYTIAIIESVKFWTLDNL